MPNKELSASRSARLRTLLIGFALRVSHWAAGMALIRSPCPSEESGAQGLRQALRWPSRAAGGVISQGARPQTAFSATVDPSTASTASLVRSSLSGQRCEYVSSVSAADACPNRA